jgi:hypothetical protein
MFREALECYVLNFFLFFYKLIKFTITLMGGCITTFLCVHSAFVKDIFDIANVSINNS